MDGHKRTSECFFNFTGECQLVRPSFVVTDTPVEIGRAGNAQVVLFHDDMPGSIKTAVSRIHCVVEWNAAIGAFTICDRGVSRYLLPSCISTRQLAHSRPAESIARPTL